jgi:thioesterase domain-containing protein
VLAPLRAAGHEADALTLTGVGDRAHLLSANIRLATHIQDVLNVIACEEMDDVILVGHSYAGMVITGVADALLQQKRPVLRHLIYVDAVAPHPGESWSSQHTPETVAARVKAANTEGGGIAFPPPDAKAFGIEGADHAWMQRRMTPQPFAVYQDPLQFDAKRVATLPRTYIDCTSPALATVAVMRQRVRSEPGWRVLELATGHDPMVTAPVPFVNMLLSCAD